MCPLSTPISGYARKIFRALTVITLLRCVAFRPHVCVVSDGHGWRSSKSMLPTTTRISTGLYVELQAFHFQRLTAPAGFLAFQHHHQSSKPPPADSEIWRPNCVHRGGCGRALHFRRVASRVRVPCAKWWCWSNSAGLSLAVRPHYSWPPSACCVDWRVHAVNIWVDSKMDSVDGVSTINNYMAQSVVDKEFAE